MTRILNNTLNIEGNAGTVALGNVGNNSAVGAGAIAAGQGATVNVTQAAQHNETPAILPGHIFISYRRDDAAAYAGRIYDRMLYEFGPNMLFMDVDAIPVGVNYAEVLKNSLATCGALLAIIGPRWLDARDEQGRRRLDNPRDIVRLEISAAMVRQIFLVPILIEGTPMPRADQLPPDLQYLTYYNALTVRHATFHADIDRIFPSMRQCIPRPGS